MNRLQGEWVFRVNSFEVEQVFRVNSFRGARST